MVRIPASRPLPENGRIERFFVTRQRVYHLDSLNTIAAIEREITQLERQVSRNDNRDRISEREAAGLLAAAQRMARHCRPTTVDKVTSGRPSSLLTAASTRRKLGLGVGRVSNFPR